MIKLLSIFCILPTLLLAQPSKGPIDLKFNLAKGQPYEYSIVTNTLMNQNIMGQDMRITNIVSYTYRFEVISDSAGWKKLNATITKYGMDINTMGNSVVVDTDNPNKDTSGTPGLMNKVFNAMKGSTFTFIMNYKGDINNISGFAEMNNKIDNILSKDPGAQQALQGFQQGFDENSFRQSMQQVFGSYPDKPIKAGSSWENTLTVKNQGIDMVSKNTYTLESVNGNDAIVKLQSKLSSSGTMQAAGVSSDVKMTGSTTGTLHYNLSSGLPLTSDSDMKMDMKVTANGMEIPIKMDTKVVVKGRKI